MLVRITCAVALLALVAAAARAEVGRFDIFPEQSVRRSSNHWVSSAYVVDKKGNQFWVCTARYDFESSEANNGDCVTLPSNVGRPSLSERYVVRAVIGTTPYAAFLPVFWFIDLENGDVQFCAPRHPGVCVRLKLP
jgi:hypothetical protein